MPTTVTNQKTTFDNNTNTDYSVKTTVDGGALVQHINVDSLPTVTIQDGGNIITVDGTVSAAQSGTWNITNISGTVSLPTGAATEVTLSTLNGKVTACDTGAVTISALPNEGQQTMANSISVAIASNQSSFPVREETLSSSAVTSVAGSASSVTLLASNANRRAAYFYNDSTSSSYIKFGATASTSSFTVKVFPNGFYEMPVPVYTGVVDGIWDSATGNMRITELS